MIRRSRRAACPRLEVLEGRMVLSALTPAQLTSAYGLNAISFSSNGSTVKGDGTGQTIAIIDVYHDANLATELATFNARYGLPTSTLSVVNLAGSRTNAGWAEEEALDVEWAHAVAPGANILVVEAKSASSTDLLAAVAVAKATAGVSVVSMSWGTSEFRGETAYDSVFTTPAGHTGITYLASSGDDGAGVEWPAASPNVVAVGGTSLLLTSAGTRASESAWSGSGGGVSQYEAEPSYQLSRQTSGRRTTPDVSLDADPNTGVSVYSKAGGGWIQVGGTSLASPVWAGLVAIIDQGRALSGKGTLDGATQTLPDLYAAPATAYNDVTTGSRATIGYDTSTGLGTPIAATLVATLVADPNLGAAISTTTTTTTTTTPPTTTTTTTTTPPTTTTTTPPRRPSGGWWFMGRYFGFSVTGNGSSTSGSSLAKNSGQAATPASTPHTLARVSATWPTHRSVDVVLESWGRSTLA